MNNHILTVNQKSAITKLIKDAGSLLISYRDKEYKIDTKDDGSNVTEADYASNELIISELNKITPGFNIVSEEVPKHAALFPNAPTWIIDPLDGTRSFIEGKNDFSILMALYSDKKVVFSLMFFPVMNLLANAEYSCGAYINGEKVLVSKTTSLRKNSIYLRKTESSQKITSYGLNSHIDSGLAFLEVARGNIDGFVIKHGALKDWDLAAPSLLIKEAGGMITNEQSQNVEFLEDQKLLKYFIGSNGRVHKEIIKAL